MSVDVNQHIEHLLSVCDRIVVTTETPFNPKNKKYNDVLADIRDAASIGLAKDAFLVGPNSCKGSWMSPVDVFVAFLDGKFLLGNVGVVLNSWLRSPSWEGDYAVENQHVFWRWLQDNKVIDRFPNSAAQL
jgi:hypothetical protein